MGRRGEKWEEEEEEDGIGENAINIYRKDKQGGL